MKSRFPVAGFKIVAVSLILLIAGNCQRTYPKRAVAVVKPPASVTQPLAATASPQLKQFIEAAIEQSKVTTGYDPSYVGIDYPNGDVPSDTGVCSDVVVRAFRKVGIDLQKELHEDMTRAWPEYPKKWGARGTDTNIDHRRVLNLNTYFTRQESRCRSATIASTIYRATWSPGSSAMAWSTSAFSPTSGPKPTSTTWLSTTLVLARASKTCCWRGKSSGTTDTFNKLKTQRRAGASPPSSP